MRLTPGKAIDTSNHTSKIRHALCPDLWSVENLCARRGVVSLGGDGPLQTLYISFDDDVYAWGFIPKTKYAIVVFYNPGVQEDPTCDPLLDAVATKELVRPMPTRGNDQYPNLINHGFEEGPRRLVNSTNGVLLPPQQQDFTSPLSGWIIESLKVVKFIDSKYFNVPIGYATVELVAGRESVIAQILRPSPTKPTTWHSSSEMFGLNHIKFFFIKLGCSVDRLLRVSTSHLPFLLQSSFSFWLYPTV
ncbi:hypothetical protein GQ457_03G025100 [Hibiscus cannabinus]